MRKEQIEKGILILFYVHIVSAFVPGVIWILLLIVDAIRKFEYVPIALYFSMIFELIRVAIDFVFFIWLWYDTKKNFKETILVYASTSVFIHLQLIGFTTKSWFIFSVYMDMKVQTGCIQNILIDIPCLLASPFTDIRYSWYLYVVHLISLFVLCLDYLVNIVFFVVFVVINITQGGRHRHVKIEKVKLLRKKKYQEQEDLEAESGVGLNEKKSKKKETDSDSTSDLGINYEI